MIDAISRARVWGALERLAAQPPQTILLEGGNESDRLAAAIHWAKSVNCPEARGHGDGSAPSTPCETCPICRQIEAYEYLDLHIYDGRISNKQDEESPGPIRAMTVEHMRQLKALNNTAPRGEGRRVAIFQGMGISREEALNSILKTLEEPTAFTLFVLLTPQRQQLLPTLVSRSLCITLPWEGCRAARPELESWEKALGGFLSTGAGFLDAIGAKGAVDAALAAQIVLATQHSLARILAHAATGPLDQALQPLANSASASMLVQGWAEEAQRMLAANVGPARVLEAFATKLFMLVRGQKSKN